MAIIHYLVDFENVGLEGIEGLEGLTGDAHIYIFSTKNAAKFDMAMLATFNKIKHGFYFVEGGAQSVDKHLVSYLRFLIGQEKTEAQYVIISKDTGYDKLIKFWESQQGVTIKRQENIKAEQKRQSVPNREQQIRCFFGQNFKEQKYREQKEKIIEAVLSGKTKTQVNVQLLKSFPGSDVKEIYGRLKPMLEGLPGS